MATKKKSPKKALKKAEAKSSKNEDPKTIEHDDLLILQIAAKSLENTELKLQLAQVNAEKLQAEKKALETQLQRLSLQVNEKYSLVPGTDTLNINTGEITRG